MEPSAPKPSINHEQAKDHQAQNAGSPWWLAVCQREAHLGCAKVFSFLPRLGGHFVLLVQVVSKVQRLPACVAHGSTLPPRSTPYKMGVFFTEVGPPNWLRLLSWVCLYHKSGIKSRVLEARYLFRGLERKMKGEHHPFRGLPYVDKTSLSSAYILRSSTNPQLRMWPC